MSELKKPEIIVAPVSGSTAVPTQVAHPWKAALRTFLQTFIPASVILVAIAGELQGWVDATFPGTPVGGWIIAGAAFVSGLAGLLARIMAIPGVNEFLTKIGLGSVPKGEEL